MTLQDWGALGELIGGVAIIVSLIYVGLQVRQSTHATRAATSQAFTDQYMSAISPLQDPDFSRRLCSCLSLPRSYEYLKHFTFKKRTAPSTKDYSAVGVTRLSI